MPTYDKTQDAQLERDIAEVDELERLLAGLPEEIVIAYALRAGKMSAAQFRLRMYAGLRALRGLVGVVAEMPVSTSRADLLDALRKWRSHRTKIAERLGSSG